MKEKTPLSQIAREMVRARWAKTTRKQRKETMKQVRANRTSLGGRPQSADRCPCGAMTAARAKARGHQCSEIAIIKRALPAVEAAAASNQDECWPSDAAAHDDFCKLTDHRLAQSAVEATEGLSWEFYSWSSTAAWMRETIERKKKEGK